MPDADGLTEILDSLADAIVSYDSDGVVLWRNRTAPNFLPGLEVGDEIRPYLSRCLSKEKLDRLLIDRRQTPLPEVDGADSNEGLVTVSDTPPYNSVLQIWDLSFVEEADRRRATFRVGATHELRTPMTALLGLAEILDLERGQMSTRHAEMVELLNKNAQYLLSLMQDVFDLTRTEYAELTLEPTSVDVTGIITDVTQSMMGQVEANQQSLSVSLPEEQLPTVTADPSRIKQVIFNLVNNASRHTPPGTSIEVGARDTGDGIEITIADNGPGLAFDNPEDSFTAFRRGERQFGGIDGGAGVGLPIAKDLVELHRGRLTVETALGDGATFSIWLPAEGVSA